MDFAANKESDVAAYFANKTILITGATGFIGKLLLEKLLRACPDIKKIFLLIRPRHGLSPAKRVDKIFSSRVYEGLLNRRPEARAQVEALAGDTCEPNLGLSNDDLHKVLSEVQIVLHSAATVKFNEPLPRAVRVNIGGTSQIVSICRQLKDLQCLLHVSTAYVNVTEPSGSVVEERMYPTALNAEDVLELVRRMPPDALEAATPSLMAGYPNTYTFSKRLAEQVVSESGLPAVIVRPSIVIATHREPFPAWLDGMNGPTGFLLALGIGALSVVRTKLSLKPDLVPADFVVNCIILSIYGCANGKFPKESAAVPVIHACMSSDHSLPMYDFKQRCESLVAEFPPLNCIRLQGARICESEWEFRLRMLLFHRLPMELLDLIVCRMAGKQIPLRKLYTRLTTNLDMLGFFFIQEWNFETKNTAALYNAMSETDRYLFPIMGTKSFNWDEFFKIYLASIKYFVLHEDFSQLEEARRWRRKLTVIHYTAWSLVYFAVAKMCVKAVEYAADVDIPLL